jgi:hypothetical protein
VVPVQKNLLMIVGGIVVAIFFAVGIVGLATTATTPGVAWPARYVISGVIAMMAALSAFVLGFVHMATIGNEQTTR